LKTSLPRVLHLLPHTGGGVGTVLRAFFKAEMETGRYTHSVITFETINEASKTCFKQLNMAWLETADDAAIAAGIEAAELVVLHWWNHPQWMRILSQGLPACRLAIWSHVNGFHTPQAFFPELFDFPDRFVFATPASFEAPVVKALTPAQASQLAVIVSNSGVPPGADKFCHKTSPFQAGYIGTVEPAKMHPEFLSMCARAQLALPCLVAGGPAHQALQAKAEQSGLAQQFKILGPLSDPYAFFQGLHVLTYPLVPEHYGTGEQVLIEAMAYGAVPLVLAHPPEKALIQNMETGILAESPEAFSEALRFLAEHPAERERMALAGHRFVLENCPIEKTQSQFHQLFETLLGLSKQSRKLALPEFNGVERGSPFHLYLTACGDSPERSAALDFLAEKDEPEKVWPPSFVYLTRGSPVHYLNLLGADPVLERMRDRFVSRPELASFGARS